MMTDSFPKAVLLLILWFSCPRRLNSAFGRIDKGALTELLHELLFLRGKLFGDVDGDMYVVVTAPTSISTR